MNLFDKELPRLSGADIVGRLSALEDFVEYLRQQGQYGFSQAGKRLDELEGKEKT